MCISSLMCSANSCSLLLARFATWSVFLNNFCTLPHALHRCFISHRHTYISRFDIRVFNELVAVASCNISFPSLFAPISSYWHDMFDGCLSRFDVQTFHEVCDRNGPHAVFPPCDWSHQFRNQSISVFKNSSTLSSASVCLHPHIVPLINNDCLLGEKGEPNGPTCETVPVNSMVYVRTLECPWREIKYWVNSISNFNVRVYSGGESSVDKE